MKLVVLAVAISGLALLALPAKLTSSLAGEIPHSVATPVPTPLPLDARPKAPILYPASGGPFIGEERASEIAAGMAIGPITRHAVGLVTYREAANWMQSWTYTIAPEREVYLVVNGAPYAPRFSREAVTCLVYFAVVDATDGMVRARGCKDLTAAWPQLPAGVEEK